MSKNSMSARHATRLILSYRRNARLARVSTGRPREREAARRTCDAILRQLANGGRADIADDLYAETVALGPSADEVIASLRSQGQLDSDWHRAS